LDEAGVVQKVWYLAGIHPRLSGAGGRCGGRLSETEGLGCEIFGCRPCQVWPSRIHPSRLSGVARELLQREYPRSHSLPRAGPRSALSHARHAPNRNRAIRRRGPATMERPHARLRRTRGTIGCSR
jgi:hypothetical protein